MKINDFHLFTFLLFAFALIALQLWFVSIVYRGRHSPHGSRRTECLSSKTKMHQEVDKVRFIIYGQYLLEQSFSFSFHLSQHKEQRTSGSCKVYYYQFILGIESGWMCAVWRRKLNSMGKVDAIWQFADEKKILKTIRFVWHINSLCGNCQLQFNSKYGIIEYLRPRLLFVNYYYVACQWEMPAVDTFNWNRITILSFQIYVIARPRAIVAASRVKSCIRRINSAAQPTVPIRHNVEPATQR